MQPTYQSYRQLEECDPADGHGRGPRRSKCQAQYQYQFQIKSKHVRRKSCNGTAGGSQLAVLRCFMAARNVIQGDEGRTLSKLVARESCRRSLGGRSAAGLCCCMDCRRLARGDKLRWPALVSALVRGGGGRPRHKTFAALLRAPTFLAALFSLVLLASLLVLYALSFAETHGHSRPAEQPASWWSQVPR